MCSLRGPLLVLGRGCALVFGRGAEVLGRYVCSTRASSFLPFLIKFLEASLEFWFAFELVFPDLDWSLRGVKRVMLAWTDWICRGVFSTSFPLLNLQHLTARILWRSRQ